MCRHSWYRSPPITRFHAFPFPVPWCLHENHDVGGLRYARRSIKTVKLALLHSTLYNTLNMSNNIKQGSVFNVEEPTGVEQVAHQTTVAEARIDATSPKAARQIDANAEQTHGVAEQAAQAAQGMGPDFTGGNGRGPLDSLANDMSQKTDVAAQQGQKDVEHAKAAGATYVDQAKAAAGGVYNSAQNFVQSGQPKGTNADVTRSAGGNDTFAALQATAASAFGTTQQYLASAQAVVQPHVETARQTIAPHVATAQATAQPYLDRAKETAQGYLGMGSTGGAEPEGRPTTSQPLEGTTPGDAVPVTTTVEGVDPRAKPPTTVA